MAWRCKYNASGMDAQAWIGGGTVLSNMKYSCLGRLLNRRRVDTRLSACAGNVLNKCLPRVSVANCNRHQRLGSSTLETDIVGSSDHARMSKFT